MTDAERAAYRVKDAYDLAEGVLHDRAVEGMQGASNEHFFALLSTLGVKAPNPYRSPAFDWDDFAKWRGSDEGEDTLHEAAARATDPARYGETHTAIAQQILEERRYLETPRDR